MITKIQSDIAFNRVYLNRRDDTVKNIKELCDKIESAESKNPSPVKSGECERIKGRFRYGLKQLNDEYINDPQSSFLTFKSVYDEVTGLPTGYNLTIINEDGDLFATGSANMPFAGADALSFAFEDLKTNYEKKLNTLALERYVKYLQMRSIPKN